MNLHTNMYYVCYENSFCVPQLRKPGLLHPVEATDLMAKKGQCTLIF